jgi:hypothetical protein
MPGVEASCWKCGGMQKEVLLPLSRTEECQHCGTDLHVCRMCRFYDTSVSNACREPVADFVLNKIRSNFCGYLELLTDAGTGVGVQSSANDGLNALFGLDESESAGPASLEDLFGSED